MTTEFDDSLDLQGFANRLMMDVEKYPNNEAIKKSPSKYILPKLGNNNPDAVERMIRDELALNKQPSLNFATFVTVWMENQAKQLAHDSIDVNYADQSIYPMTTEIGKRIIHMAAEMLHAKFEPGENGYIGSATIGSSEAVMLGIITHKRMWQEWYDQLEEIHKPKDGRVPNMVIGGAYQAVWEKVYKFYDIAGLGDYKEKTHSSRSYENPDPWKRCRIIPLEENRHVVTADKIMEWIENGYIDENTIAIGLVAGTTLTGEMDEISKINDVLKEFNDKREVEAKQKGTKAYRIPIHVDAAYGGFVLPFAKDNLPTDFEWDFKLSEVQSINISNHKFGLVYPGLGTVVFRDTHVVPDYLKTKINYLGKEIDDYAVNFSRASWQVIAQYYNFIRLGENGYKSIMSNILNASSFLARSILKDYSEYFELLTEHKETSNGVLVNLPNLVFKFKINGLPSPEALGKSLSQDGWTVPIYTLPKDLKDTWVMRLVVKENTTRNMAELFLESLKRAANEVMSVSEVKNQTMNSHSNLIC